MTDRGTVAGALVEVRNKIAAAAVAAERQPASVALVAIAKKQPIERVRAALEAGHRVFGENRVQEAQVKWPELKASFDGVELHLVGPLQTNKVRDAVALFDVIQTVDRAKLAKAIAGEADRSGRRPQCFVQVNTGNEPQKSGVAPEDADAFVAACQDDFGLSVAGLMCIPPADEEPSPHFALLAKLAKRMEVPFLSMGMSADFEIAVRFGATHVRVGTAIFGKRPD